MSASFPYEIKGKLNVEEGYNYSVCIECEVNKTKTQFGNYSIRQIMNCANHIKDSEPQALRYQSLPFNENSKSIKISKIFEITGEEFCGNVTCDLMNDNCIEKLTSKHVTFE